MKKLVYLLLLVALTKANAQDILAVEDKIYYNAYEQKNKYFKDINNVFNKFLGNWKFEDNATNPSKILEVTIYKVENYSISGYYKDCLYATYKYYENGIEIFNTENTNDHNIYGGVFRYPDNTNKYHMIYDEPTQASMSLRYDFNIEYIPNSSGLPQLKWDVNVISEIDEGAELPRIPQHIILTKVQ